MGSVDIQTRPRHSERRLVATGTRCVGDQTALAARGRTRTTSPSRGQKPRKDVETRDRAGVPSPTGEGTVAINRTGLLKGRVSQCFCGGAMRGPSRQHKPTQLVICPKRSQGAKPDPDQRCGSEKGPVDWVMEMCNCISRGNFGRHLGTIYRKICHLGRQTTTKISGSQLKIIIA